MMPNSYPHPQPMHHPRPRPARSSSLMGWLVIGGVLMMGILVPLVIGGVLVLLTFAAETVPDGVQVAGVSIGGQSVEAATAALHQTPPNSVITLRDGEREWSILLQDLGIGIDVPSTVEAALAAEPGATIQPRYRVDLNQTQEALIHLSGMVNIAPIAGNPGQAGRAMEIPVILERLRVDLTGELADGVLDLAMITLEPPQPDPEKPNFSPTVTSTHTVERGQELALIARMYGVTIEDIVSLNGITDPNLISAGQQLIIPAAGLYQPATAPEPPTRIGKAIVVSTREQRIYAYEDGVMIHSHLTSTGRAETPTVLGDYKIYVKYARTDMRGADYYLKDVPYTMYFYQGYGIHGTYWHNSFGRPMSHGCVNLPTEEARWFFEWAEVGTPVRVI